MAVTRRPGHCRRMRRLSEIVAVGGGSRQYHVAVQPKRGALSLALIVGKYWSQYIAWKEGKVRRAVFMQVRRMLSCRTPKLGLTLYRCESCDTVRVVPHSCKSVACSSCGKVRTDAWCKELLTEILDVAYRHLVFTLP